MKLTFRYPVYPTKTQETTLFEWLDHLCELQNSARHDRKVAWEIAGERVSCNDQQQKLKVAREKYADFREVPQDMQVCALERTDKAFDGFYSRCEKGTAKKGYPRHRKQIRSMSWKLRKHTLKSGERVRQNPIRETAWKHDRLKVPKLGEVKIYMHRPLQGDPKSVTLVKKASGWYAHIVCERPDMPKVEATEAIAVDMGTTHYLTTSEGEKEDNPCWYRQAEGLTRKHSKDLSRKKKGSNRSKKQRHKLALHHERTANRRQDFIGKLVYKLYHHKQNNVLVAENLSVSNMVKNKHLSKSISDASWSAFFKWCADIAERDGLHFHKVDPKHTSQICSSCGQKSPKKLLLAIRTFDCSFCGTSLDRDHNAAINILFRAATALRGERWVTTLNEARNKNEATKTMGFETAEQLLFNDLLTSPSL
ncbi:transposase [Candidatus Poribacteria bacterium]|nr:MAG: transposase [Candidatus Poribacteria bacterium]